MITLLLIVLVVLYVLAGVLAATQAVLAYEQRPPRWCVVVVFAGWPVFAVFALVGDLRAARLRRRMR